MLPITGRGPFLPVVQPPRPLSVDPEWSCQQSGECCTKPSEVVMTKEEAAVLVHHAPPTVRMSFRPLDDPTFVALKAGPCPLYVFKTCLVYAHRPYNCRRFACMRPDVTLESFDGELTRERRTDVSRGARRLYQTIQRRAQRWARSHGWVTA